MKTADESNARLALLMVFTALLLAPHIAEAHIVGGAAVGFWSGFRHPISGLDHIIGMVTAGMWGAQLGNPAIWILPADALVIGFRPRVQAMPSVVAAASNQTLGHRPV